MGYYLAYEEKKISLLKENRLNCRLTLTSKLTEWADIFIPIGGDGTFLLTANRACPLFCNEKPIIGFNSDPDRSEGRLLLPKQYSSEPRAAIRRLISVTKLDNHCKIIQILQ